MLVARCYQHHCMIAEAVTTNAANTIVSAGKNYYAATDVITCKLSRKKK